MFFDYEIACLLDNELKKKNINRNISKLSKDFEYFSLEDLNCITSIEIEGLEDISFLLYLPKLTNLEIKSSNYCDVTLDGSYIDNPLFNNINDFTIISRLTNLESLKIINDVNIRELDLSNLVNLKNLVLLNNPRLSVVKGLENLHNLIEVELSGNNIKVFQNFQDFLHNLLDAKKAIIDTDAYLANIKSAKDAKKLYDMALTGYINKDIKFSERSGIMIYTTNNLTEITDLYRSIYRKLKSNGIINLSSPDKIEYLFNYALNIPFALNEIKKRDLEYQEILQKYNGKVPFFFQTSLNYLHNSYTTYQLRRGNCEGIVNLMHFIAAILGLESKTVYCRDKRSNTIENNHALIRIKLDDNWYYFDPTYNRQNAYNYYYMNLDNVSTYADLPKIESTIQNEKNNRDNKLYNGRNLRRKDL